jgi:Winged helix-turn helix
VPRLAAALQVASTDLAELASWLRSPSTPAGLAQRARIITLAADGVANTDIAELAGCSRQTVVTWRQRFTQHGIAGLHNRPRPGRPRTIDVHSSWRSSPPPWPARHRSPARRTGPPGHSPTSLG